DPWRKSFCPLGASIGGPVAVVSVKQVVLLAKSFPGRPVRCRVRLDGDGLQVYYSQTSMAFERVQCIMHQIAPRALPSQRQGPPDFIAFREKFKKNPDALLQEALAYLRESGFRVTKPREVIVRSAISFAEPFHAEDLLAKAREVDRLISLATIYRTLPMML